MNSASLEVFRMRLIIPGITDPTLPGEMRPEINLSYTIPSEEGSDGVFL